MQTFSGMFFIIIFKNQIGGDSRKSPREYGADAEKLTSRN